MRVRKAWAAGLLGLAVAGCGPAEIVPMTPPGVAYRRPVVEGSGMDAEGEQRTKTSIRPKNAPAPVEASPASGEINTPPKGAGTGEK